MSTTITLELVSDGRDIVRPVPTRDYWHPRGEWRCVCVTPTHRRGQRFVSPQCQYCERVPDNDKQRS